MPFRLSLYAMGLMTEQMVNENFEYSKKFNRATWGILLHDTCAVVGGGASVDKHLETLRNWKGDIFAINDTAKYLSDNGISCYLLAIDGTDIPFKIGPLVKGALFASRVHKNQFDQFPFEDIRMFDMAEEDPVDGIEGGATAVCRTPHLLLKMGYAGICYFGCEGSFFKKTHVGGDRDDAFWNLVIVRADNVDYLTNAGFIIQNKYMADTLTQYPKFLRNFSGGLLEAMIKHPDTWEVVAVTEGLKKQYDDQGAHIFNTQYPLGQVPLCQM